MYGVNGVYRIKGCVAMCMVSIRYIDQSSAP